MVGPNIYRKQIEELGIEDMVIDTSSLTGIMDSLKEIEEMEKVLKMIRYNLRSDLRMIRADYITKIRDLEESAEKKGLFGRKMSSKELFKKKKALIKERNVTIAAYEVVEKMIDNYLDQIDESRIFINQYIESKVD